MSKAPSWLDKANQNTSGNTVGKVAEVGQVRNKPGPTKAAIERKTVGLKFSKERSDEISKLELLLKQKGFPISRGRSETVEIAVSVLLKISEEGGEEVDWDKFIDEIIGQEERDIQNR